MNQRTLLFTLLILIMLGGGLALYYAHQQTQGKKLQQASTQKAMQKGNASGQNVTFTITQGGLKRWEILSKKADYFENNSGATLQGVQGTFFNNEGKAVVMFTSPAGEFRNRKNTVILTGGVIAKQQGDEAGELTAPKMSWSAQTDQVLAEGGVRLNRKDFGVSTASQCHFSMDFKEVFLQGNVQTQIDL